MAVGAGVRARRWLGAPSCARRVFSSWKMCRDDMRVLVKRGNVQDVSIGRVMYIVLEI